MISNPLSAAVLAVSMIGFYPAVTQAQGHAAAKTPPSAGSRSANAAFGSSTDKAATYNMLKSLGTAVETARTMRVTYTRSMAGADGTFHPIQRYRIAIDAASHKARFDVDDVNAAADPRSAGSNTSSPGTVWSMRNPTYSIYDGKQTIEYNATDNRYLQLTEKAWALTSWLPSYGVFLTYWIRDVRGFTSEQFKPAGEDIIDGRKMIVLEDLTGKTPDGDHPTFRVRDYIDAKTHLRRRLSSWAWSGNAWTNRVQMDYTDWSLNTPISPALFAWTPPAGAKLYVIPPIPKPLAAGALAPNFTCMGSDGKPMKLSDLHGKIVVLDFWATWCGPCQASMPHLEQVYQATKNSDVAILALCVSDDKAPYDRWRVENKDRYNFPVAYDPAGKSDKAISTKLFGVGGIPTQYIIGKDGKVVAVNGGFDGADDHRLEAELAKLGVTVPVETKTATSQPAAAIATKASGG